MTTPDSEKQAAFDRLDRTDDTDELGRILNVLLIFAATGQEFSANEVRPTLPKIEKTGRIGRAFSLAVSEGWLEVVGDVKSGKRNTHGKKVLRYRGRLTQEDAA